MKKGQNTAIIILLALILVTLAVLCVVLISNRLQPTEQTASNQQQVESPKEEADSPGQISEDEQDEEGSSPQHEGQYEVTLEGISLYFPEEGMEPWLTEKAYSEGNQILVDEQGMPRTIAELISLDAVEDSSQPFAPYDTAYADAETIEEHTFGSYSGKSYSIQKYVEEGGVSGYENTIIYCVQLEQQMAVISFHPARGLGGISTQADGFEEILASIERKGIDNEEETDSETMKQVDVSCPVQDKVSGVIEGETIELSLEVPSSWQQADTGTTFYQEDGTKGAEGFFATKVPEGQTIWSTAKVDLTPGYVSSQTVTIQGQEVLLSICSVPWGKEQEPPEDQKEYCYNYYVPYQDVYITIQIYAVGKDNAEAMQLHKEILESISFPSEALTFQTATFSWENQSNKNLTLQVDVPDTWIAEKDADASTIDRHFNNENGLKIAGSFGIVYTLSEGESLQSLQNPANLPTSILESNLVVIGDKEFLLEKANLSDPLRPELFVYNYCFEQDGAVMNFYFYNDSDDQTQIPLYETILDSIDATIS